MTKIRRHMAAPQMGQVRTLELSRAYRVVDAWMCASEKLNYCHRRGRGVLDGLCQMRQKADPRASKSIYRGPYRGHGVSAVRSHSAQECLGHSHCDRIGVPMCAPLLLAAKLESAGFCCYLSLLESLLQRWHRLASAHAESPQAPSRLGKEKPYLREPGYWKEPAPVPLQVPQTGDGDQDSSRLQVRERTHRVQHMADVPPPRRFNLAEVIRRARSYR